jgi:membrane protease subunit HflC
MLADLKEPVLRDYGIEVKTVGIKQLKVSEAVTKKVFDRMKSERKRRTQKILAEGQADADSIRTEANKQRNVLLAAAEARAKEIRGQGDADAAIYYQMLEEDPGSPCICGTPRRCKHLEGAGDS